MSVFINRRDRAEGFETPPGPARSDALLTAYAKCATTAWREGGALAPLRVWVAPPRTDFGRAAAGARGPLQRVRVRLGMGRRWAVDYARKSIR